MNPQNTGLRINDAGLELVKHFEGLHRLGSDGKIHAYPDKITAKKRDGTWLQTIGYGHTGKPHGNLSAGTVITVKQADELLRYDMRSFEKAVLRQVAVPLTSNQFAALVSFTFNLGEGNLQKSTLLKKLNNSDYAGAAKEFHKWRKSAGVVRRGLVRRRAAEAELFLTDEAKPKPIADIIPPEDDTLRDHWSKSGTSVGACTGLSGIALAWLNSNFDILANTALEQLKGVSDNALLLLVAAGLTYVLFRRRADWISGKR